METIFLELIKDPADILHKKLDPVTVWDLKLMLQLNLMHDIMIENNGVGLAANQVGLDKRMFVMQLPNDKRQYTIINPVVIVRGRDKISKLEGCLSLTAEESSVVERSRLITIRFRDIYGKDDCLNASGLMAQVIQHELDHLDGKLINDR